MRKKKTIRRIMYFCIFQANFSLCKEEEEREGDNKLSFFLNSHETKQQQQHNTRIDYILTRTHTHASFRMAFRYSTEFNAMHSLRLLFMCSRFHFSQDHLSVEPLNVGKPREKCQN